MIKWTYMLMNQVMNKWSCRNFLKGLAEVGNFFLELDLLCFLEASQSQFTALHIKLLYQDSLLELIQLSFHDPQSDRFYNVSFHLFFLYSQHLSSLCITGLFNVFEKTRNRFNPHFSGNLLFLQVEFFPYSYFLQCWDISSHSSLQQWIKFMGF